MKEILKEIFPLTDMCQNHCETFVSVLRLIIIQIMLKSNVV